MKTAKLLLILMALTISIYTNSQNCSLNAGIDQSVCTSTVTLTGAYSAAVATTWSQVSGPTASITSPSSLVTTVTGLVGGNTYRFRISGTCGDGLPTYDEVTVTSQSFPVANAGNAITICTGTNAASLSAGALQSGETGVWTFVSTGSSTSTGGLAINSPTSPTSTLTLTTGTSNSGNVTLRWTVTNTSSGCTAYSDVVVTKIAVNTTINAGIDKTINSCYTSTATSTMTASYSGGGTYGRWTVISGPNTPTITSPNNYNTTVTNLVEGNYILRWTVTAPCFSGSDDVVISVGAPGGTISTATASIVGNPTMPFCDPLTTVSLSGTAFNASTETVTWTKVSGAGTISSPNERYTTVTGLDGVNSSVFRYTINNPTTGCSSTSSNLTISFEASQTLSITTASPYLLACNTTSATINISHTGSTTPQWSVASGPTGYTPTIYTNISGTSFTATNLTLPGNYVIRVKKTVGTCTTIYDDIDVVVSKSPSASNAGSDPGLACNATSTTLIGNSPTYGTGKWTQLSGPNTATIATPLIPQTNITGLVAGVYEFRWTISNGAMCATTQDEVRVRVAAANPTTSDAGDDQTICNTSPLILDGNSPVANETGTWTVSPAAGVSFSNRNSSNAIVTGLAASTVYTFTWTILNNCSSSADNVIITTSEILGPIASLAGDDQCLPSGTSSLTLAGNSPSPGTGLWTKLTGGVATITNPDLNTTTVTGLSNGTYTFEWAISRNACTITRDTVTITISAAVTNANAGSDQMTICGTEATLQGNTPSVGTGTWTQLSGPAIAVIANPTSPTSSISGLVEGQYTFRWTISNGACSSSYDDVVFYASNPPTLPLAGNDITVCGSTSTTMVANTISSGIGYWNVISGPNAPNVTTNSSPTTTITGLITGVYRFTWNSRTLCSTLSDEVVVTVVPAASAGTNQTLCGVTSTTLTGNANTTGTWSLTSPAQTVETITTTAANTALASNLIQGTTYTFKYTLSAAEACALSKEASVTITVLATPTPANAGPDQDICISDATTTITLAGNSPAFGSGIWTRTSGSGTITSSSSYNTTVTSVSPGISVFTWTTSNGACTFADQVVITVSRVVARSAGSNQEICGSTATMAAESPTTGVGTWSQIDGPNQAIFASSISNTSTVTGLIQGTYVFRWTITDGNCSSTYSDMSLEVNEAPTTPNAGANQELCNSTTATLQGNTITNGTGTWSKISGPSCTITNVNSENSTVTGMTPGTYIFQWTASNGTCTDLIDQVTILNNQPPTNANAGNDIRVCMYSAFNLSANTPSVGTGSWSQVSGSTINFTNAASPTTTITGAVAGNYTFRWSIITGDCTASTDDVSLIIDAAVTEPNAGEDQLTTGYSVTMAANTISSGVGVWSKISGPSGATITNSSSPTTTITELIAGTYVYRWTATNSTCSDYDEVTIVKQDLQTYNIIPNQTFTTCNLSWSNGSMTSRVVFMKEGTGSATNPVNTTTYNASANWEIKGSQLGSSGFHCIYNGTGNSVLLTGLYPGRTYTVRAYEYTGSAGSESYLTYLTGAVNPTSFVPWPTTTFSNSAGVTTEEDWDTSARWDHDTIPSTTLHEAVLVYIDGNCVVNSDANCYNLTIKAAHDAKTPKLTISTASSLNVVGGELGGQLVNSGNSSALVVKSSATQPTGTLIWNAGSPFATVEMYSKASWDLSKPANSKYKWQYMGIPVKSTIYSTTFSSCYVREWDESVTVYEDIWTRRNDGTSLTKASSATLYNKKGYELVQQYPRIYIFKGMLERNDFEQSLAYTPTAYYKGQHVLSNPYTAAINIRNIEFGENTEHAVYQYNTGTYTDWFDGEGERVAADGSEITPGRYSVSTPNTAGVLGILGQIPSMQGFLVKATNVAGGSIRIPYPIIQKNTLVQRVKKDMDAEIVATRIDVRGTNFSDKMWFFVDPVCTRAFDNSWDGIKLLGDEAVTQIYGIESDGGIYQINAVDDINDSYIAFKPGNDKDFVLKFTHQNIQSLYSKLLLVDIIENKTIDITANGSEYKFSGKANDTLKRFKIITGTTKNEQVKADYGVDLFKANGNICINNRNSEKAKVMVFDEIGRCITNAIVDKETQMELDVKLTKGVYLIKINVNSNNFTKRIILN